MKTKLTRTGFGLDFDFDFILEILKCLSILIQTNNCQKKGPRIILTQGLFLSESATLPTSNNYKDYILEGIGPLAFSRTGES